MDDDLLAIRPRLGFNAVITLLWQDQQATIGTRRLTEWFVRANHGEVPLRCSARQERRRVV
jgi:hypothetical protein